MSEMWMRLIHNICALNNIASQCTHHHKTQWWFGTGREREREIERKKNETRSNRKSIYFYSCEYVYRKHVGCIVNRGSFVILLPLLFVVWHKHTLKKKPLSLFNLVRFGLTPFFGSFEPFCAFVTLAAYFFSLPERNSIGDFNFHLH